MSTWGVHLGILAIRHPHVSRVNEALGPDTSHEGRRAASRCELAVGFLLGMLFRDSRDSEILGQF